MKKMIMVAAIVCAAAFTQAATVGWTCAGLNSYAGNAYKFFVVGQNGVESASAITALIEAGTDVSTYAFGSGNVTSTGTANTLAKNSGKTLDAGKTYESFYVFFDNADVGAATKYLAITKEQGAGLQQSPAGTAATFAFAAQNQSTYANTASNWKSIGAVPEPTSGLLLLLGMAGLALKRKVA